MLDEKGKDKVETKITKTVDSHTKWMLAFWVFIQVVFVTMVYRLYCSILSRNVSN